MVLDGWREWRRHQRAVLLASNHLSASAADSGDAADDDASRNGNGSGGSGAGRTALRSSAVDLLTDLLPTRDAPSPDHERDADRDDGASANGSSDSSQSDSSQTDPPHTDPPEPVAKDDAPRRDFGRAGKPLNRQSPFYVGFFGALGVLLAYALWGAIGQMGEVFTLLLVALFLTLALDPIVQFLTRRGLRRGLAVTVVFLSLMAVATVVGLIVVPPVADQGSQLARNAPQYLNDLLSKRWVQDLDKHYQIITKLQTEVQSKLSDGTFLTGVFGGVLGASRLLISGFFSFFTVAVLTLYFLGALPSVKRSAYAIVPASRRDRVASLSEEVMRRVGSYAIGQVAIASVNAVMSFIMMSIVGIPYAAVLAVAVGFLGLVPMVGAGLGAVVVCSVAVFDEPHKAVIALIYYVVYQQIENYVIVPRIMQRTVSVPGAVTIVSALAGGTLLGMLGALLAIPVAAGLLLLYEEVLIPRQRHY